MPRLEILAFHRVLDPGERYFIPPMTLARPTFVKLLDALAGGYEILDLRESVSRLENGSLPERCLSLTFDDGYVDNYALARECLSAKGIPATFFLPLRQIDSGRPYWWDHLRWAAQQFPGKFQEWAPNALPGYSAAAHPKDTRSLVRRLNEASREERGAFLAALEREFGLYRGPRLLMDWDEARELWSAGFAIGSHTLSHEPLTDLDPGEAAVEIRESRTALAERLGAPVSGFCYPRGAHSGFLAGLVKEAGYAYAVTTGFGSNSPGQNVFLLRRRSIADYRGWRGKWPVLASRIEISGILDFWLAKRRP